MNYRTAHGKTACRLFLMIIALASAAFGSVTLYPGDDIQTAINYNPEGTTFVLNPGVYRLSTGLIPRTNDVFIGMPGSLLNGSRLLTSWTQEVSAWVTQTPTQHQPSTSLRCSPNSYAGCHYNDAVFYDDQPLWRVMTKGELAPGKVYVDPNTDRVYLADYPLNHKVEMATSARAFVSSRTGVVNVTIQGLTIEKFASAGGEAALEAGADWTILNNEIRLNHGMGLSDGKTIRGNFVHHNGELGIGGGAGSTGMLVENNEISFNNTASFDWYMEGGATKWFNTNSLTLRGNYVHDNMGPGLWTDGDNINTLYENNHTKNNAGPGIFHEISFDAVIRNNLVEYDSLGAAGASLWWGAGIFLNSSSNVEIYGNTVAHCLHGIGGSSTDHGSSWLNGKRYVIQNVNVYNNVIIQESGLAAGFVRDSSVVPPDIFTGWNNRFDYNTYYLTNLDARNFEWSDWERTNNEWRSYGNDVHGTFLGIGAGAMPPNISIASPANGATVSGTVIVNANSSNDTALTKVEFYVDGTLRATNNAAPWIFSWDSSQAGTGNHALSVKAYNAAGNTAGAQVTVTIPAPADTTKPTVSISSPANNSTVAGIVTVSAIANDNVGVTKVQLYLDGALLGTSTAPPWNFVWNTAAVAPGSHTLMAVAYDAAGNFSSSAITVNIGFPDVTPPISYITFPANNSTVSGVITVTASATDDVGVAKVQFYVDGTLLGTNTAPPWNFVWDTTQAYLGSHTLVVIAYDAAGNRASSVINVNVAGFVDSIDTTPPVATITSPINNSTVSGVVTVSAIVTDNVGVAKVQFYVDGRLMATNTAAPWNFTWDTANVIAGAHTLMVVAYDAAGNHSRAFAWITVSH